MVKVIDMGKMKKVLVVTGPTASGKTSLAVFLARKFNGEIISADSRQVFRGLDIGTGKDLSEYGEIKYHLIDILEPEDKFNVFLWKERATKEIEGILKRGKLPIVTGGTGLYILSLIFGFSLESEGNEKVVKYSRDNLEKMNLQELVKIYKKFKGEGVDEKNPHRLIRFIEKKQAGERPVAKGSEYDFLIIGPKINRENLYNNIDRRVDERIEEGMVDEIRGLIGDGVDPNWLISLGLEYRIIGKHILDGGDFKETIQVLKWKIHQYAKRQVTFMKKFKNIQYIESREEAEKKVFKFLK